MMFVVRWSLLFVVRCVLFVVCCSLFVVYYWLYVVRCSSFLVCRSVCQLSCAAYCLLFVRR